MEDEDLKLRELQRRLIYTLLTPVVRLGARFELPLKEMTHLMRVGYFRELRNAGADLGTVAEVMDMSVRTVKRLNSQVRQNFFAAELEYELPKRIEFMLWATPMSRARIAQVLSDYSRQEIDDSIAQLLAEERIRRQKADSEVFTAARPVSRLVRDSLVSRIGSVRSFASNVGNAVYGRFFATDSASMARTITFRVRASDVDELRTVYEEGILKRLEALEARVEDGDDVEELQLSICWAPLDLVNKTKNES